MKTLSQGAEATIYHDVKAGTVVKSRHKKDYRIEIIDNQLRKSRTRREAKVLTKLADLNVPSPTLVAMDDKKMDVTMQFLDGPKVRDELNNKNFKQFAEQIGKHLATMHTHGIIHGDLTTSNMIHCDNKVHFIDFGLSFFSQKIEDMAVDVHLFRQALESKHSEFWEACFEHTLKSYEKHMNKERFVDIMTRFKKVEARGRNKH